MKSICMTAVFLVMVLLTACQGLAEKKNVQSNETTSSTLRLSNTDQQKYQETSGETVQGIERWWLKRNENHQTPEVSDYIDLSKYDAYYVNPKCKKKKIFLTFDCGYENGFTPKILDVLKKQKIVAAFFVTKPFIREGRELVRRMTKEGHIVGNHTMTHPDMSKISTQESFQKELSGVENIYKEITGKEMTKFYRPPQGIYSTLNLSMSKEMGYHTFFWSLAYVDWYQDNQPDPQEAIEKLTRRIHPGAIVLLHSTSSTNAQILDELLNKWEDMGYSFHSLNELIEHS